MSSDPNNPPAMKPEFFWAGTRDEMERHRRYLQHPIPPNLRHLEPDDRRWIEKNLDLGWEHSLHQVHLGGVANGPSEATDYRSLKSAHVARLTIDDCPYFDDLLRVLDAHRGIPPHWKSRIAGLLLAHWERYVRGAAQTNAWRFEQSRRQPENMDYFLSDSPFCRVHEHVFGPTSIFQTISKDYGPLAAALWYHRARRHMLHQVTPDTAFPPASHSPFIGPYPNPQHPDPERKRTRQFPRQFPAWLTSTSLPKRGWFTGVERHLLTIPFSGVLAKAQGRDARFHVSPPDKPKTYAWSAVVVVEDYLIYQYARTCVVIIQALRALTGDSPVVQIEGPGAEVTVRELLSVAPPQGMLLHVPPDKPDEKGHRGG